MIALGVCLPSKFNLTSLLVGIFLETTAALCKQMSITSDLMDSTEIKSEFFHTGKGCINLTFTVAMVTKMAAKIS